MKIEDLPPLREIIANYNLKAFKALGQNFLLDLNLTSKIARSGGDLTEQTVIEIGPGPGGLTRALLLSKAKQVIAIEKDPRCINALQSLVECAEGKLKVYEQDALTFDFKDLGPGPFVMIANLPYNIATPLLIRCLKLLSTQPNLFTSFILMFQREVAERLTACVNTKMYGRLAVMAQSYTSCRRLFDIPASAFTPAPKVISSVVELVPSLNFSALPCRFESLEQVTQSAFGQRRKMLRSSLKNLFVDLESVFGQLNLQSDKRAENLSVSDFNRLAYDYENNLTL